jgi:hypothetical protein
VRRGAALLIPSILCALFWTVFLGTWSIRQRLIGGLLLGVVLGVPIFMVGYPRYLSRVLPKRMAAYAAALPVVLEADRLHCPAGSAGRKPWCELQDYLPAAVTDLGQVIVVEHDDDGPVVRFIPLGGVRLDVVHSSRGDRQPLRLCDLGNGWSTNICYRRPDCLRAR